MPEQDMRSTAFWLHFPADFMARFADLTPTEKKSRPAGLGRPAHGGGATADG
jgi:hypothetical protein